MLILDTRMSKLQGYSYGVTVLPLPGLLSRGHSYGVCAIPPTAS
jgi:hypothetical protein